MCEVIFSSVTRLGGPMTARAMRRFEGFDLPRGVACTAQIRRMDGVVVVICSRRWTDNVS